MENQCVMGLVLWLKVLAIMLWSVGKILSSAQDVYDFCIDNLEHDEKFNKVDGTYSKREFVFVEKKDVECNRSCVDVKTAKGTRKLHAPALTHYTT